MNDWKSVEDGATWVPVLNEVELQYGIPADLLARIAYQESTFKPDVISGAERSKPGAEGLMQLMPQFFASVKVPTPYTEDDTKKQIHESAQLLVTLHKRFNDWQVAVAAYNWGGGNVNHEYAKDAHRYVLADMPTETQKYVYKVFADVPIPGVLLTSS